MEKTVFSLPALLLIAILAASCDRESSASPTPVPATPSPVAAAPAAEPASRNILMGTGEPRIPERFTPQQRLLHAVRQGDRAAVQRIVERGVSVGAKDDLGRNTLFLAVLDAGDLDLVRWLRSKGAVLDEADVGGRTPLSFAAEHGRLDICRYLIENGASVDHLDIQQRTALFQTALTNHRDVAAFLLDQGADVNVRDQFGDTPLIAACAKGNGETAELLLVRGADPTAKDQEGRTASQRAAPGTEVCEKLPPQSP